MPRNDLGGRNGENDEKPTNDAYSLWLISY